MTGRGEPIQTEPVWIEEELVHAIHDRQLAEHGGLAGVRDPGALVSALARARKRWAYGDSDFCTLAADYAFGVARNHPFADGNKRTAWVLARLFLAMNGIRIAYAPADAIAMVLKPAAGDLDEGQVAQWFRQRQV